MQDPPFPVSTKTATFMLNSSNPVVTSPAPFPVSTFEATWVLNPPAAGGTVPDYSNGGTMNGELIVHPKVTTDAIQTNTVDAVAINAAQGLGSDTLAVRTSMSCPNSTLRSINSTYVTTADITSTANSNLTNINCNTGTITNLNSTNFSTVNSNIGTETVGTLTAYTKVQTPLVSTTDITASNVTSTEANFGTVFLDDQLLAETYSEIPKIDINGIIKTRVLRASHIYDRDNDENAVLFKEISSERFFAGTATMDYLNPLHTLSTRYLKLLPPESMSNVDIPSFTENSGTVEFTFKLDRMMSGFTDPYFDLFTHFINTGIWHHYTLKYQFKGLCWVAGSNYPYSWPFELASTITHHDGVTTTVNYDGVYWNVGFNNPCRPYIYQNNSGSIYARHSAQNVTRLHTSMTVRVNGLYWG